MTRNHVTRRQVVRNVSEHVSTTCDFCGGTRTALGDWPTACCSSRYDDTSAFYREEISWPLRFVSGRAYPEGGTSHQWELDLCPRCFETKILPLALKEKREPEEVDW